MVNGKEAPVEGEREKIAAGLKKLRRRRWMLWSMILIYVPAIWLILSLTGSDRMAGIFFGVWVLVLCVVVCFVAFVPCPRCGKPFHMQGFVPLYLRRCLHCELHVCADKRASGPRP